MATILYYLKNEGRTRKVVNSFGMGKSIISKIIKRVLLLLQEFEEIMGKTLENMIFLNDFNNFNNNWGWSGGLLYFIVELYK